MLVAFACPAGSKATLLSATRSLSDPSPRTTGVPHAAVAAGRHDAFTIPGDSNHTASALPAESSAMLLLARSTAPDDKPTNGDHNCAPAARTVAWTDCVGQQVVVITPTAPPAPSEI